MIKFLVSEGVVMVTTIVLQLVTLTVIGCLLLFKKYLFYYSTEKGKNLATKEDIEGITRKVESTKNEYVAEIERLKVELALLSRKNDILFDEKIRVFKKLQKILVNFKRYCEAALGTYDNRGEFHPTLESLDETNARSALIHIHALHQIQLEDFIFLSKSSNSALNKIYEACQIMPSMELHIIGNETDIDLISSTTSVYEEAMTNIDICLQSLYDELEFPAE